MYLPGVGERALFSWKADCVMSVVLLSMWTTQAEEHRVVSDGARDSARGAQEHRAVQGKNSPAS